MSSLKAPLDVQRRKRTWSRKAFCLAPVDANQWLAKAGGNWLLPEHIDLWCSMQCGAGLVETVQEEARADSLQTQVIGPIAR